MMSLLLFGSSYKKNKKISVLCYVAMLVNLLITQIGNVNIWFLIINFIIFASLPLLIVKIKNKNLNAMASVGAVLIWSIVIDTICYFLFPKFVFNQSLIAYIGNGIAFNTKYVFTNIFALITLNCVEYAIGNLKLLYTNKIKSRNKIISSYN